jgi:predicted nucleic acid-binding Zn ribbon protein
MPLYRYQCQVKSCRGQRKVQEHLISHKDTTVPLCSACQHPMTKLLATKGGFVLTGQGWEKDGYRG